MSPAATTDMKAHWERIYNLKKSDEVSWYQQVPSTSLELIETLNLPKSARICDYGAGDSRLVDYLLALGYENITAQDISLTALKKTIDRLGEQAKKIKWIEGAEANCSEQYDLWHDRA